MMIFYSLDYRKKIKINFIHLNHVVHSLGPVFQMATRGVRLNQNMDSNISLELGGNEFSKYGAKICIDVQWFSL